MAQIYGLYDPTNGALCYIGKANCAAKRLRSHLRDCQTRNTPVYQWMRDLSARGLTPKIQVLEEGDNWQEIERRWIDDARWSGVELLNVAAGGSEPHCPPTIRSANAHRLNDALKADPRRARMRSLKIQINISLRRGYVTNATRAKMRALAARKPREFGAWASIPDREEAPHAST